MKLSAVDPWRPEASGLHLMGGARVQGVHLNEPNVDGAGVGMQAVVKFCQHDDAAVT